MFETPHNFGTSEGGRRGVGLHEENHSEVEDIDIENALAQGKRDATGMNPGDDPSDSTNLHEPDYLPEPGDDMVSESEFLERQSRLQKDGQASLHEFRSRYPGKEAKNLILLNREVELLSRNEQTLDAKIKRLIKLEEKFKLLKVMPW